MYKKHGNNQVEENAAFVQVFDTWESLIIFAFLGTKCRGEVPFSCTNMYISFDSIIIILYSSNFKLLIVLVFSVLRSDRVLMYS